MKVGVLIPCYNEAAAIGETVRGARSYLPEVIVVDDGSGDDTARAAREAGAEVLQHPVNQGKGAALQTGFSYIVKHKDWAALIILDGDGQQNWKDIPKFISAAEKAEVV